MKLKNTLSIMIVSAMLAMLTSCTVIEGIFKAGVWVGMLLVILVIGIIIWIIAKIGKK
jgi:hypothetical protein